MVSWQCCWWRCCGSRRWFAARNNSSSSMCRNTSLFFSILLLLCFLVFVSQNNSSLFFNLPSLLCSCNCSLPFLFIFQNLLMPLFFFLLCLSIFIGRGREAYLVLSSHGDRVRWPGRPLCRRLQDFSPLYFHLGTSRGVGLVSFLVLGRERKREKIQGSKPLLSMPLRIQGKKKQYSAVQNSTVSVLFLGWKK